MTKVETLERLVRQLDASELADFRHWSAEFDTAAGDRAFEADVAEGRLDRLAN